MVPELGEVIKVLVPDALSRLIKDTDNANLVYQRKDEIEKEIGAIIDTLVNEVWIDLSSIEGFDSSGGYVKDKKLKQEIGRVITSLIHEALSCLI